MKRGLLALCIGALVAAVSWIAFGRSGHRVTPDEARRAFAQVGLSHPKVQRSPPGVTFNYGKPPHNVSVGVFYGAPLKLVYIGHNNDMRVTRWANVTVFYNKSETQAVRRASKILGDHAWASNQPPAP